MNGLGEIMTDFYKKPTIDQFDIITVVVIIAAVLYLVISVYGNPFER